MTLGFTVLCSSIAIAQMRTVTGTVTDNNKPISAVSVYQEGSDIVILSDSSGKYFVQVSGDNPILVFKHPDYPLQKLTIGNRSVISMNLSGEENQIEEVILNAGYYQVQERENTGSIAKVTAKDIANQPVTNVMSSLQGRMAGVNITQNSGTAGGGFDVQIRGRNSLRSLLNSSVDGSQPLYVIDGVPLGAALSSKYSLTVLPLQNISPLNAINPNDIESIEILKDADATAIYGSRGANGVILISTKKGRGKTLSLQLNTQYGLSNPTCTMKMMSTPQYLDMRRQAYANAGISTIPTTAYDVNGVWSADRDTNWQDELIGKWAESNNVQLSISGGTKLSSFLISASHSEQGTVFPGDFKYKTNILNSNYNYTSEDGRFKLDMSNIFSDLKNNVVNTDLFTRALTLSPNAPALYDASGNINWQNNTFANPIASLNGTYNNSIYQINQNLGMSYRFLSDFHFKLNTGINYQNLEEFSLQPHTMYNPSFGMTSRDSSTSKSNNSVFTYLAEPQVGWEKSFGNHQVNVLLGGSFQQTTTKTTSIVGVGFSSNSLMENLAAATTKTLSPDIKNEYKYVSAFARLNYQFKSKYILNLTGRRDGSSRFGINNRFANFGALGAAWLFSKEQFLDDIGWLSFGKLRASYGITGSDFIGDYQYLDSYTISGNIYNTNAGLYPSRLYNPDFSWEQTKKLETALELGLFKNALNFSVAYYRNVSSGQLVGLTLPATTGFSSVQANLNAEVENKGWELELSSTPINTDAWQWRSSFNISYPENKLLSFPNLESSTYATRYVVGMPISIVKLFDYTGINDQGQYTFTDYNGDGKISSPDDALAIRNIGVKYFGGWQNELRYGNFTFSFLWQFVKQTNWNFYRTMTTPGNMNNQPVELLNVWSPENPNGVIMPYSPGTVAQVNTLVGNFRNSTAAVGDASFIRLKNVQINYKIPVLSKWLKDVVVYAQGQNLWTITDYFGVDPEFVTTGFIPPLKTYSLGFQVKF
ncbi:TonB-linked outer membrane protein, SusC/RagA family [Epilithonimonas zeae]|uniref:TonB-linked outer membrane protein, SusC/RagA family n=2 Tax=Epilithonimonas zeae TaxID=1416779 RepID=A0A1N6GQ45_9FLAO|nr:TonB-linked outer membrane protein, SusC/RagA family [Epilithonimonas zeae]